MEATTVPQHLSALDKANRHREVRATIKRQVKAGHRSIADVLNAPPPEMATMAIGDLLRSQHRWGRKRVSKFLAHVAISWNRALRDLSPRQRAAIAEQVARVNSRRS